MTKQEAFKTRSRTLIIFLIAATAIHAQSRSDSRPADKGQIVAVEGIVEMKKVESSYSRVSLGTSFYRGNLLKVGATARATVVCVDGIKHELKNGIHPLPCKPPENTTKINVGGVNTIVHPTRSGENNPNVPIILSPRKTKLLNPRPTLRWIPGARPTNYIVNVYEANLDGSKLEGTKFDWTIEATMKNECQFPTDPDKQLTPGVNYMLTIQAGSYSSDEESVPRLVFSLLSPQEAQSVRDLNQIIDELGLPRIAAGLLTAQHYAKSELHAEAIELLQTLSAEANEPVIAQLLGDLYVTIRLNRLAMESYLTALKYAEAKQDNFSITHAQISLGQIYEVLGDKTQALKYWRLAKENRQWIEDPQAVQDLDKTLERLQKN